MFKTIKSHSENRTMTSHHHKGGCHRRIEDSPKWRALQLRPERNAWDAHRKPWRMSSGTSRLSGGKRLPELTLQGFARSSTGIPHSRRMETQNSANKPLIFPSEICFPKFQPQAAQDRAVSQHLCLPCTHIHPCSQLSSQNSKQIAFTSLLSFQVKFYTTQKS